MREHLGFLKTSGTVVKIAAWIFLFLGLVNGVSILLGQTPSPWSGIDRWGGIIIIVVYTFFFFFFYLIAKIADLLVKIISAIDGLVSGGDEVKKE